MTATKTLVKVAEYRDRIYGLSQAFASLRSAATPAERVNGARWVGHAAKMLRGCECRRAAQRDADRAESLLAAVGNYLAAAGLDAVLVRLEAADVNLQRMAFGAEYR